MSPETLQELEQVKYEITTLKNDIDFVEFLLERWELEVAFIKLSAIRYWRLDNSKLFRVIDAIKKEKALQDDAIKELQGLK